ncbi:MAG TPA: hypothetical protein VHD84_01780 [Candidatus Saccharimonadales bacterium]|nr:hypothetical protein [Candidatus Saccharimonadales bacterium]
MTRGALSDSVRDLKVQIRMFDVKRRRRDDAIATATVCDGTTHHYCYDGLHSIGISRGRFFDSFVRTACDGRRCQGETSEPLDLSLLPDHARFALGLYVRVPRGKVLFVEPHFFSDQGDIVLPERLEMGRLLEEGEAITYIHIVPDGQYVVYARNEGGIVRKQRVGKEGRRRTATKLAKLRRSETGQEA